MKEINILRRNNLELISKEFRSKTELAKAIGKTSGYISQLLGGYAVIGEKSARSIEKRLGKYDGWLDVEHDSTEPVQDPAQEVTHANGIVVEHVSSVIKKIARATEGKKLSQPAELMLYSAVLDMAKSGVVTEGQIRAIIEHFIDKK